MRRLSMVVLLILVLAACGSQAQPTAAPAAAATPTALAAAPTIAPTRIATATAVPQPTSAPSITPSPTQQITDSRFGRPALVRGTLTRRPIAAMLDNHPDAYPQTGLDEAALVFEALAEYGITRYMAVFAPDIVPVLGDIGPVRSARLYFVQWAIGMRAIYVHAGGSPTGLERLDQDADTYVINLDALVRDHEETFFRRDLNRFAPHNLYTSQAEVDSYLSVRVPERSAADLADVGYLFDDASATTGPTSASSFGYFFIYADDPVSWSYDAEGQRYWRFRRGQPHIDAVSGEQLWFKSVVVMEVHEAPIPGDPKARIDQEVVGEGPALAFIDGTQTEVTWRKESETAPLRFYTAAGQEVVFPVGPLWIAAVPELANVSVNP